MINVSGMTKADAKWHIKAQRQLDKDQAEIEKATNVFKALAK